MRLRTLSMAAVLAACGPAIRTNQHFEVTGAFHPDGRCEMSLDGVRLTAERGYASVGRRVYGNVLPPGMAAFEMVCDELPPDRIGRDAHSLAILTMVPADGTPRPAAYALRADVLSRGERGAAEAHLFAPRFADEGLAGSYLISDEGTLTLSSVDSTRVVGSFRFRGVLRSR